MSLVPGAGVPPAGETRDGGGTDMTTGPVRGGSWISTVPAGAAARVWKKPATREGCASWFENGRAASTRRRSYVWRRARAFSREPTANGFTRGSNRDVSTRRERAYASMAAPSFPSASSAKPSIHHACQLPGSTFTALRNFARAADHSPRSPWTSPALNQGRASFGSSSAARSKLLSASRQKPSQATRHPRSLCSCALPGSFSSFAIVSRIAA